MHREKHFERQPARRCPRQLSAVVVEELRDTLAARHLSGEGERASLDAHRRNEGGAAAPARTGGNRFRELSKVARLGSNTAAAQTRSLDPSPASPGLHGLNRGPQFRGPGLLRGGPRGPGARHACSGFLCPSPASALLHDTGPRPSPPWHFLMTWKTDVSYTTLITPVLCHMLCALCGQQGLL